MHQRCNSEPAQLQRRAPQTHGTGKIQGLRRRRRTPGHSDGELQRASRAGRVHARQPRPRTAQLQLRQPQGLIRWLATVGTEASFRAGASYLPAARDAMHEPPWPVATRIQTPAHTDGSAELSRCWQRRMSRRAAPAVRRRHRRPRTECHTWDSQPHSTPAPSAAATAHLVLGTRRLLCLPLGLQLRAAEWSVLVPPRAAVLPGKQRSAAPQLTLCLLPPAAAAPGPLHIMAHYGVSPATLCWSARRLSTAFAHPNGVWSLESKAAIHI